MGNKNIGDKLRILFTFILLFSFILLLSTTQAVIIEVGTILQPNSSLGYYIVNESIQLTSMEINGTHAILHGLYEGYQSIYRINTEGIETDIICIGTTECFLPQTNEIKQIIPKTPSGENPSGFITTSISTLNVTENITEAGIQKIPKDITKYKNTILLIVLIFCVCISIKTEKRKKLREKKIEKEKKTINSNYFFVLFF